MRFKLFFLKSNVRSVRFKKKSDWLGICFQFCDTWALKLHLLTPSGDKEIVGVCEDSGKNGELLLEADTIFGKNFSSQVYFYVNF